MNRFVFIAVNYNGLKYTKDYIDSIKELTIDNNDIVDIIIIDNKSELENFKSLHSHCKSIDNVRIVKLNKNLGYFKGLNQGISIVEKDDNTMLIVGNNDLTFEVSFIQNLKKINYDDGDLVIAPNIITKEGRQQNPHVIEKVPRIQKVKSAIYYSNYYIGQAFRFVNQSVRRLINRPALLENNCGQMRIKRGIGACYVLTPNFFKYFNQLDDRVFMWGEEALLSNQVESVKGYTLYDPTIKITHHESASVSSIQTKTKYYMRKESYKVYRNYL